MIQNNKRFLNTSKIFKPSSNNDLNHQIIKKLTTLSKLNIENSSHLLEIPKF